MGDQTICRVDDGELVRCIKAASGRVVFAAPGLSKAVATVLGAAWRTLGRDKVSVILDVDPAVCRLGYGSLEGITEIQGVATSMGALVCHQPGLRVGILVTDHVTLVYTPTPLLIEPEPGKAGHSNGIVLANPPGNLSRELGIGPETEAEQTIGLEQVPAKRMESLAADLKANPPLPFDIARPVLVFNSQVEFVEFSLEKIQLQRQEIPIPPEVMGLAASNIHGLFRLEMSKELLAAKQELEDHKKDLDKQFTRPVRGFGGSIIRRAAKADFEKQVDVLKEELESFREKVREKFHAIAEVNKQKLVDLLLPIVRRSPPKECLDCIGRLDQDERLRRWLLYELHDPFAKVTKVADDMRVTHRFKGVTHECLRDPEFIGRVHEVFPDLQIHEEFLAAREKPAGDPQLSLR